MTRLAFGGPRPATAARLRAVGPPHKVLALETSWTTPLRIAKPLLAVTTPLGVAWGVVEAWRFHWWLAVLMAALVAVIGAFFWMTVARIRSERAAEARGTGSGAARTGTGAH